MMSKDQEQPPKVVKQQLIRLDDNLKRIERSQISGIQRAPGSLPVLEAFQKFLETERQKTQKRARKMMLAFAAGFGLALIVAVAATLAFTTHRTKRISDHFDEQTATLSATVDSLTQQQLDQLDELEARFSEQGQQIIDEYRAAIERQQAKLNEQQSRLQAEIDSLKHTVTDLRSENNQLKSVAPEAIVAQTEPMIQPQSMLTEDVVQNKASASVQPLTPKTADPGNMNTRAMRYQIVTIQPRDESLGPVRWMLPTNIIRE